MSETLIFIIFDDSIYGLHLYDNFSGFNINFEDFIGKIVKKSIKVRLKSQDPGDWIGHIFGTELNFDITISVETTTMSSAKSAWHVLLTWDPPIILNKSFIKNLVVQKCQFRFGERYWGDLKLLCNKSWNFDFSVLYDPLKLSILANSAKILPFSNLNFI